MRRTASALHSRAAFASFLSNSVMRFIPRCRARRTRPLARAPTMWIIAKNSAGGKGKMEGSQSWRTAMERRPGILLIARLFVSRAGGHQSPQSPTYEQAGERSMEFFLLLFLTSGPKGARARHRAVVRYAFVDASVASVPWPKGHGGRLGASTLFRRHARYRLDLGVARVRAGFSRRANYLPPGQGCHRPSGKQRHGTMPGKETAI